MPGKISASLGYSPAIGRMKLSEVSKVLNDVSKKAEIVGLSIAEHMAWDALNLRKVLSQISIFN